MIKYKLIISMSFIFITSPSVASESNLEDFTYPPHNCGEKVKKPIMPAKLSEYDDVEMYNTAITKYNIQVTNYNKEIKIYKTCINQYIKNGNNDIAIIKKKLNKALKEARAR